MTTKTAPNTLTGTTLITVAPTGTMAIVRFEGNVTVTSELSLGIALLLVLETVIVNVSLSPTFAVGLDATTATVSVEFWN